MVLCLQSQFFCKFLAPFEKAIKILIFNVIVKGDF